MDATKTTRSIATTPSSIWNSTQPRGKTSPASDEHSLASGAFHHLIDAIGVCMKYKSAYCDIERTQDQLSSITLQLNQATTEMENERRRYTSTIEGHENRVTAWAAEREDLKRENKRLVDELATEKQQGDVMRSANTKLTNDKRDMERTIKDLRTDFAEQQQKTLDTEKALNEAERAVNALTTGLKESEQKLDLYESYTEALDNIDIGDFSKDMGTFWEHSKSFVEKYIFVDISSDLLQQAQWESIIDSLQVTRDVPPLPLRNSAAAKQARVAAALAVIASYLSAHIFTPVYMPTTNDDIRAALRACAEVDCKREAMCRALLLSAYEDNDQSQAIKSTVRDVTGAVSKILSPLIDRTKLEAFRIELRELFQAAVQLWRRAQYSVTKLDATVDDSYNEESDWDTFLDSDSDEVSVKQSLANLSPPRTFVMLVLFPRVIVMREEEDEVVFRGIALRNWQAAEAAQELREDMEARRVLRGAPRKERKATINGTGSGPPSPTKAKRSPFLE